MAISADRPVMKEDLTNETPARPEGEVRTEHITVRLTVAELYTLQAGADVTGERSVASFIRRAALLAAAGSATQTE
jgi:uncharacterized protein (DUF1778 family)